MNKKETLLLIIKDYFPHKKVIFFSILLITLLTFLTYQLTLSKSRDKAMDDLALLLELRHAHLERYVSNIDSELAFWSEHGELRIAAEELSIAWQQQVKHAYLTASPYPRNQREKLYTANSGNNYDLFHNVIHHLLKPLTEKKHAYTDIMLINTHAEIIYSVKKNNDYGQNLQQENTKNSPLARLYRQLSNEQQTSILSDALLYSPSDYQPLFFAGKNMYHLDGGWLGVLIFTIPLDVIATMMQSPDVISSHVNSYIVGQDLRLRTPSSSHHAKILEQVIPPTEAIQQALLGKTGTSSSKNTDEQGKSLLTAYRFFAKTSTSSDTQHAWALIAEKPLNEVHKPSIHLFFVIFVQIILVYLIAFVSSRFILRWTEGQL